jgi:hypothetical protein
LICDGLSRYTSRDLSEFIFLFWAVAAICLKALPNLRGLAISPSPWERSHFFLR